MNEKKRYEPSPELRSDKINTIIHICLICGAPTGETMDWRESDLDPIAAFKTDDPKKWCHRSGVCGTCMKAKESGHVLMYSDTRGVILAPEAKLKLKPEFREMIIKIPEEEMDKMFPDKSTTETTN